MSVGVLVIVLSLFVPGWPWQFTVLAVIAVVELLFEALVVGSA